jgi:hypothetical protein
MKTLLASVFFTISIISYGQKAKIPHVLFDGLYESKCIVEVDDDEGSQSYLRFYHDG